MFIDRVRVFVAGGSGGAGAVSFRKERGRPRGRPDGGDGGDGGDVVVQADQHVVSLLEYRRNPHRKAGDGTHGEGDRRQGRRGEDLLLPVPPGTVVFDASGTMLADLVEPGQQVVVARGARGGRGNAGFVSPARKAPHFAEQGEYAEEAAVVLEIKLLADAALIGFPNAGKSTLISRVSAARPKVADYPFTTLEPHLGVVDLGDRQFVLADIPGLIEGASQGRGLGHEFLRHVERARVLVVLLDPSPLQELAVSEQYEVLVGELAAHSPDLAERPRLVAVNKVDAVPDLTAATEWASGSGIDLFPISAVTGSGVDRLMQAVAGAVVGAIREAPARDGYLLHRPFPSSFAVHREDDVWVVTGQRAERAVRFHDLTIPEAAALAARRLARMGVDDALAAAGALPGDDVRIGDLVFTYEPETYRGSGNGDEDDSMEGSE